MKIYNRSKQFNKGIYTCSAMRRLFEASLIVLGLLCVFWNTNVLRAFSYEEITARITFVCQKTEGLKNNSYQICIKPESGNVPVPDKDTIAIDDSGQGEFLLKLTEPGTYNYLLYENKGSEKEIDYDDAKYEIHVFVTSDNNGKLEYSVSVTYADSDTKPSEGVSFKNKASEGGKKQEPTTEETPTEETTTEKQTTEDDDPDKTTEATKEDDTKKDDTKKESGKASKKSILTEDKALILFMSLMLLMSMAGIVIVVRAKIKDAVVYSYNEKEGNGEN